MPEKRYGRILAVRLDNVGDVVMLSPALRALRGAFPSSHITLLCSKAGATVAPMLPGTDETIVHRALWQDVSGAFPFDPAAEQAFIASLAARRFDAAFIFTSFSQSPFPPAYACYLAGIPQRFGESKEFGGSLLTVAAPPLPDHVHQVDRNLHLLAAAGIPADGTQMELHIPPSAAARASELLTAAGIGAGVPFVALAPGASCDARRYDTTRLAEAARLLVERTGLPIVVVGTAADTPAAEQILSAVRPGAAVSLAGATSVPELAAVICAASLLVTNNSGPLHLADAFGRPQVVLYSGTEFEEQWRPRHSPAVLQRKPTACSPCFAFTCPYDKECLDIDPATVAAAALRLLETAAPAAPTRPNEEVAL